MLIFVDAFSSSARIQKGLRFQMPSPRLTACSNLRGFDWKTMSIVDHIDLTIGKRASTKIHVNEYALAWTGCQYKRVSRGILF